MEEKTLEQKTQDYIDWVLKTQEKYKRMGEVILEDGMVSLEQINRALASFWQVSGAISAEYQRIKHELFFLEIEFERKTDKWFTEARRTILDIYSTERSIKPAVKEYDIQLRRDNEEEYYAYVERIKELEVRKDFLLRMRDSLNKMDSILVTLSANLRHEAQFLDIERRGNPLPQSSRRKIE